MIVGKLSGNQNFKFYLDPKTCGVEFLFFFDSLCKLCFGSFQSGRSQAGGWWLRETPKELCRERASEQRRQWVREDLNAEEKTASEESFLAHITVKSVRSTQTRLVFSSSSLALQMCLAPAWQHENQLQVALAGYEGKKLLTYNISDKHFFNNVQKDKHYKPVYWHLMSFN